MTGTGGSGGTGGGIGGRIKVMLVEDHNLVRAGIRSLLENVPEVEVVAEAGDGQEALRKIELFGPDVVLMDIALPRHERPGGHRGGRKEVPRASTSSSCRCTQMKITSGKRCGQALRATC